MSLFGPIVTGEDVTPAIEAFIRRWQTTYLAEVERHSGRPAKSMAPFRSFVEAINTNRFGEDQLPSCVIVVPGIIERPEVHGDGSVDMTFGVGVAAVVSARDRETTNGLAKAYAAAMRMLFIQHPSVDSFAKSTDLMDERYDPIPFDASRTLGAGIIQLAIKVQAVNKVGDGPIDPPADPYTPPGDWTTVEHVFVDVEPARG